MDDVPLNFIQDNLVCEFDHWDICLHGLIKHKDRWFVCRVLPDTITRQSPWYKLTETTIEGERREYLEGYREAYPWWFYEDGKRLRHAASEQDAAAAKAFSKRWKGRNPFSKDGKD